MKWKFPKFQQAKWSVECLCGQVYLLKKEFPEEVLDTQYSNIPAYTEKIYVVQNVLGEPITPTLASLEPDELRAIADHKEKGK